MGGIFSGKPVTTFSSSEGESGPWEPQIPYILSGFEEAKRLYEKGVPEYYPGETLAGFDPAQTAAQQAVIGYSMGPRVGAMQAGSERQLLDTYALAKNLGNLGGMASRRGMEMQGPLSQGQYSSLTPFNYPQYSDLLAGTVNTGAGSPYGQMTNALTQDVIGSLQKDILPGLRTQAIQYGGPTSRDALESNKAITAAVNSGLTKPLAQMYSDAYQTAQGMRLPAAQMGLGAQQYGMGYGLEGQKLANQAGQLGLNALNQYPSTMMAPLGIYAALGEVGAQRRAMTQEAINRDMARYDYQANAPMRALQNYMAMITGNYGGTYSSSSTQTQPGQSPLNSLASLATIASIFMP